MKEFAQLFALLDQTNKTNLKVAILKDYFLNAPDKDKLWVLALFTHKRPKRQVKTSLLRLWAAEVAGIEEWMFNECYNIVGDLAETIALTLPKPVKTQEKSLAEWIDFLIDLGGMKDEEKKTAVLEAWDMLNPQERFIFVKLMSGGFRIGVSQNLIVRAIAEATHSDKSVIAHRIMGNWNPDHISFFDLILSDRPDDDASKPYPFCLAHPVGDPENDLGNLGDWTVEWKWDGIRGQIIIRKGKLFVWSRGEELVTEKFPEFEILTDYLPDGTVLDGEILAFKDGHPLPFADLQTRIGRKNITKSILINAPVVFFAYDILEYQEKDVRRSTFEERRNILESLLNDERRPNIIHLSEQFSFSEWEKISSKKENAREHFAEGLMLKRNSSPYHVGRKKGDWWKWKLDPLTIDGVLIYAQKGHGRRSGLYTDYTFGVWNNGELVVFAKAYSGLSDQEFRLVDAFVKKNTRERFGPVRTVKPELVFEIGFEGISRSSRHKSGVALRFPRMLRWRQDKKAEEANRLDDLLEMLPK